VYSKNWLPLQHPSAQKPSNTWLLAVTTTLVTCKIVALFQLFQPNQRSLVFFV
jgi:hypothetical protein